MKAFWWKFLGILLLIYAVVAGLLVPLSFGIDDVSPVQAPLGEITTFKTKLYNGSVEDIESYRAWLKYSEDYLLPAKRISVHGDGTLDIDFQLPMYLPEAVNAKSLSIIVDHPKVGTATVSEAITVRNNKEAGKLGAIPNAWKVDGDLNFTVKQGWSFPFRNILVETIRNTYFHVAIWLAMMFLFIAGVYNSVMALRKPQVLRYDAWAHSTTLVGLFFGILGLLTGMVWAKYTWGRAWSGDVKQNMTAIALLIYFAYFIVRNAIKENERRSKVAAALNIFAFVALIPLIYIIPRMTDSLHPGNGGNPALGGEDLDGHMRLVFYPAIIGWTLLGFWMAEIKAEMGLITKKLNLR